MSITSKKRKILAIILVVICIFGVIYFVSLSNGATLEKYKWGTAVSDKYLSPVMVNAANFILQDGVSISATDFGESPDSPVSGDWSIGNGDLDGNLDPLPEKIYVDWLSLHERTWYKGTFNLPRSRMEGIFKKLQGHQLILGLAAEGETVVWVKGKRGKQELATFKAAAYQPNWKAINPNSEETEPAFIDRVYRKISSTERDEINLYEPLETQKPVNGIYSGIYEFITIQNIENQKILVVHKLNDTIGLLNPPGTSALFTQGDLIRLKWKLAPQVNARDTLGLMKLNIALNTKLFKMGKLAKLARKGLPKITMEYNTERVPAEGRQLFLKTVKYYLANAADANIRNAIDKNSDPMLVVVNDKFIKGVYGYEVRISPFYKDPSFVKTVYYHSRSLFNLSELPAL